MKLNRRESIFFSFTTVLLIVVLAMCVILGGKQERDDRADCESIGGDYVIVKEKTNPYASNIWGCTK